MRRTTVYFPDEMKTAIEGEAARRGVTEAEVIRGAVTEYLRTRPPRRDVFPVFREGLGEDIAGRTEELLQEMGHDRSSPHQDQLVQALRLLPGEQGE